MGEGPRASFTALRPRGSFALIPTSFAARYPLLSPRSIARNRLQKSIASAKVNCSEINSNHYCFNVTKSKGPLNLSGPFSKHGWFKA